MRKISATVAVLRRFRELSGKTQEQIAKETGINKRTVERFESGATAMTVPQMEKYLIALNITHLDLAVALQSGNYAISKDIESMARMLPAEVRAIHLDYLLKLTKALNKKGT